MDATRRRVRPQRHPQRGSTLLRGGAVYASKPATAMLVVDGRVAWLGDDQESWPHRDGVDEIVDLDGALVTPAFVDAHVHATSTGQLLTGLDLVDCPSLAVALDRIERFCRGRSRSEVLLGHGWDETRWPEGRAPSRAELDGAAGDVPLYLTRIDVHSAVATSALLDRVPHVAGDEGWSTDGPLTRSAHHRARTAALGAVTPQARTAAQRAARQRAAEVGIGAFHELGGPEISSAEDFTSMLSLATSEAGPDVVGYWGELGGVERARELGALGAAGDLFADGAIGSRTACLRSVYSDVDSFGTAYLTAAEVRDHVVACTHAGLQAGFHSIGDGAMEAVLAGFEEAAEICGIDAVRAARHRIEHVEMVDVDLISRMAKLGIHASVQPVFDALWGGIDGMYAQRLGEERALTLNPFASMEGAGIPLALGSDSPVTPLGPWEAVRAAVQHHVAGQRLSLESAFRAHTVGGWRAAGVDDTGLLDVGTPATFALWAVGDTPPTPSGLPDPTDRIPTCLRTVVRGVPVYTREGAFA